MNLHVQLTRLPSHQAAPRFSSTMAELNFVLLSQRHPHMFGRGQLREPIPLGRVNFFLSRLMFIPSLTSAGSLSRIM